MPRCPDHPLARLHRADPILHKLFFSLVTTDPYVAVRRRPCGIQRESKDGKRTGAVRIEDGRSCSAKVR